VDALGEFSLLGIRNTAAFLRDVVAGEPFARADLSTRFIPEHFPQWQPGDGLLREALIAAALAAAGEFGADAANEAGGRGRPESAQSRSPWARMGNFELWDRR
jgi:acetyl/propionyl-CoA carboxylase alpha subunit